MRENQIIISIPNWTWMMLLFALALGVRLLHLTSTDIAGDEPFSIFVAQFEPSFIIDYLATGNNPPLFELILHYWMRWVGRSEFQLRLLPAIFSALTVVPIFLTGSKFFNRQVGFLASMLFIFSTWNIRFSHELRVYPLLSFFTAISIWFFLSVTKNPQQNRNWIGLAVSWVLMLYSHYVSVYMIVAQLLIIAPQVSRYGYRKVLGLLAATAVAYLPHVFTFFQRVDMVVVEGGTWVPSPGWGEVYGMVNLMLNDRVVTAAVLLVLAIGFLLNRSSIRPKFLEAEKPQMTIVLVSLFLVPYLSQYFISKLFMPMFTDRYIQYASVPLYLSVAVLIDRLWSESRLSYVGPILLIAVAMAFVKLDPPNNRQVANAVDQVKEWKTPDTEVIICPVFLDLAFSYHFQLDWLSERGEVNNAKSLLRAKMGEDKIYAFNDVSEIDTISGNRVIYFDADADFLFPNNGILSYLNQGYELKDSAHFHQIFDVYLFEKR